MNWLSEMTVSIRTLFAGTMVAGALIALPAATPAADTLPMVPQSSPVEYGEPYISIGGVVQARQMPHYALFATTTGAFIETAHFFATDPVAVTGGPAMTIGYVFKKDALPSWLGRHARLEVPFSWVFGRLRQSLVARGSGFLQITSVNAANVVNVPLAAAPFQSGVLRTRFRSGAVGLRAKADHHLANGLILTPSVAMVGNWGHTRYLAEYRLGATGQFPGEVQDNISTYRIGGEFGLDLTWRVTESWELLAGVVLGVFHQHASLNSSDCSTAVVFVAGAGSSTCSGTAFRTSASDSRNTIGWRTVFSLGIARDYRLFGRGVKLTVMAFTTLDGAAAGVRHPNQFNANSASIELQTLWSYGGFVMLTIPLN